MRSSQRGTWFMGIDLGTGSCKSVVVDAHARVIGFGACGYTSVNSDSLWSEQDPDALVEAMVCSVRDAIHAAIEREGISPGACGGVSLGGAYHSIMAVDTAGEPLTGVITWVDGRAAPQAEVVRRTHDAQKIYQQTGCPVHAMYPLYKLIWLREERPQVFDQAARFISGKEYALAHLTGEYLVDIGIAAGTGLLNTHTYNWDPLSLELAGITPDRLATLCSPTQIVRNLNPDLANQMGIPEDTPLVVGSADAVNSSLGAGAVMAGHATCMVGTSGAFRIIADQPVLDHKTRTYCYAIDHGHWLVGGAINNGGLALSWFREVLNQMLKGASGGAQLSFEEMIDLAGQVKPGADGLICLPFLAGERSPYWNMNARGVFFGLTLRHDIGHMSRALMEGVAFRLCSLKNALLETGVEVEQIFASGGFTRSDLWLQIVSSVMDRDLLVPEWGETSSLGAAFWALMGSGVVKSFDNLANLVPIDKTHSPDSQDAELYDKLFSIYMDLYFSLGESFDRIAELST